MNKKIALFVFLLILFGILLIFNNSIGKKTPNTILPTGIPVQKNTAINPSYKNGVFIPTYSPEKGSGVDLEAPVVANSMKEIQKLYPFLPYEETIKTSASQEATIVISDKTSQTNQWTLQVDIFGLNYHLVKGDPEYITMKNSFINAVSFLNKWIEEKGADPKKIMIIFGDQEYIQNKSQEWLE